MDKLKEQTSYFGTEKISKIFLKLAPPVMLAQLIQALYNIVDSLFVGRYSDSGLTALSIVYPLQLIMIALAVGTGVGINTAMAAKLGVGRESEADEYAGVGTPIAVLMWAVFAAACYAVLPFYASIQTDSAEVAADVVTYGRIVCVFSFGVFLESIWTKVLQARGDMKTPMLAQIFGAVTNIVLDPILIFGKLGFSELGVGGAAIATVAGQTVAALVVMKRGFHRSPAIEKYKKHLKEIFRLGMPSILMQLAYTVYIFGFNMILSGFCDEAVTVLGLYYKWQTFFFIPFNSMQTCIVPVISFNYAAGNTDRCKKILNFAMLFGMTLMLVGAACFELIPRQMLGIFSSNEKVIDIGATAFRIIGISFIPLVPSLNYPIFFQSVGKSLQSTLLTVIRTIVLFVPLALLFSLIGLNWFWLTYPVTDTLTASVGFILTTRFFKSLSNRKKQDSETEHIIKASKKGVIITIAREHGSSGKQIGKEVAEKLGIPFYYKEMTALAAQESGLDKEFISDINKNSPTLLRDLYLSTKVVQTAVTAQHKIIQKIAENGSCVIVGRAANFVLRDSADLVRIFIHAPVEYRIARVMEVYGDSRKEAEKNVARSDAARAAYYKSISSLVWGSAENYDLTVDSSCGLHESADRIVRFIREREAVKTK